MDRNIVIQELVDKWIAIADKDLLTAELLLKSDVVVTETICYHCQQSVEKYLKAYLVKHQIEFSKTHNIMTLINICASQDVSFKNTLEHADILTDYAVEIRYPDDWYEPTIDEANEAYSIAVEVKKFVLSMLSSNK